MFEIRVQYRYGSMMAALRKPQLNELLLWIKDKAEARGRSTWSDTLSFDLYVEAVKPLSVQNADVVVRITAPPRAIDKDALDKIKDYIQQYVIDHTRYREVPIVEVMLYEVPHFMSTEPVNYGFHDHHEVSVVP